MKNKSPLSQDIHKDEVGRSGVYPMSGPHPLGNAELRGQMEWGQGERGASGYYDHGSSELSMASGVLVGGLDPTWTAPPQMETPIPEIAEIQVAEWPAFCAWFTEKFRGFVTSIEMRENGESRVIARDRPLEELTAHILENLVAAITIVAQGKPRKIRLNVTGPRHLKLYRNPAGWPTKLEIEHEKGIAVVHFTGTIYAKPGLSSNAWGE